VGPTQAQEDAAARVLATIDRRNADVPPGLAALAATQGGRGFLPQERLAPRVISAENAWVMTDIMGDVIKRGTGVRARVLNRGDIAGKTGTTDDQRDAWFNGFNSRIVATSWVGFDGERSLGDGEEGSRTAVPVWVYFMREALRGTPEQLRPMPPGVVRVRISPRTGAAADPLDPDAISEVFLADHLPPGAGVGGPGRGGPASGGAADPLF
jgi:penicillin-binding protein 1A